MKILTPIDLAGNEFRNAVLQNLSSAPASPKIGQMYFNTVDKTAYIYSSTGWKDMALGATGGSLTLNGVNTATSTANFYAPVTPGSAGDTLVSLGSGQAPVWRNQKFASCSTSGGTTAKMVTFSNITLTTGLVFAIKFVYANTAATPTLNIGNSGAKGIYYGSKLVSATNSWVAGETVVFVYDGTYWRAIGSDTFGSNKIDKITSPTTGAVPSVTADGGLVSSTTLISDLLTVSEKGAANGVCPLDVDSKVPSIYLPAYIDSISNLISVNVIPSSTPPVSPSINDFYYNTINNKLYKCTDLTPSVVWTDVGAAGDKFYDVVNKVIYVKGTNWTSDGAPTTGVIYVDLGSGASYRWSGSALISIIESTIHKYISEIQGNGNATTFTITHGLNTRDVIVSIYENFGLYEQVYCDVFITSLVSITVMFAVAPILSEKYKVVITA